MKLSIKQTKALDILEDQETNEFIFGGGAGGGKSVLGCYWTIKNSLKYPETRWLIGRAKLSTLIGTTFKSFKDVCKLQELRAGEHFIHNQKSNIVTFLNGSEIFLKDLFFYPSDPNFDELGSLELTGGFIDECNQTVYKAWDIVNSRIRYKLDKFCHKCAFLTENSEVLKRDKMGRPILWRCGGCNIITKGLIRKLLGTCNPDKNWVRLLFYKKHKDGNLEKDKQFLQSLAKDNPNLYAGYEEDLRKRDKNTQERLLYGNWEYDDDPTRLMDDDAIQDLFTNIAQKGTKYISCDPAGMGDNLMVLYVWDNFQIIDKVVQKKSEVTDIENAINAMKSKHSVGNSNIVIDEGGGYGWGVSGKFKGCRLFRNNGKIIQDSKAKRRDELKLDFEHLKTQCYHKLAQKIRERGIGIDDIFDTEYREMLVADLEQIRAKSPDKNGKTRLVPKDEVKERLNGRSPDFGDAMMMRMIYELKPIRNQLYFG